MSNWFPSSSRNKCGNSADITPCGFSFRADTGYETVDIGPLRQDIVGHDQVRTHSPAAIDTSRLIPEPHLCGDADRLRNRRYIARGFEAEAGNAALNKVPQEVAVIAGQLKDKAPLPSPKRSIA